MFFAKKTYIFLSIALNDENFYCQYNMLYITHIRIITFSTMGFFFRVTCSSLVKKTALPSRITIYSKITAFCINFFLIKSHYCVLRNAGTESNCIYRGCGRKTHQKNPAGTFGMWIKLEGLAIAARKIYCLTNPNEFSS